MDLFICITFGLVGLAWLFYMITEIIEYIQKKGEKISLQEKTIENLTEEKRTLKEEIRKFQEERDKIKAIILGETIECDMALYRNGNYSIYATEDGNSWYTLKKFGEEICTYKWDYARVKAVCDQYAKDDPS